MVLGHALEAKATKLFLVSLLVVYSAAAFDVIADLTLSGKVSKAVARSASCFRRGFGGNAEIPLLLSTDLPLNYTIFNGSSCLRYLPDNDLFLFDCTDELSKTAIAALLLMNGLSDAAHECVLGVTPNNVREAEYAATNRGKTSWSQDHPLSYEDDIIHALIHLREGDTVGEGNYTGWENAKYWISGGPKKLYGNDDESKDDGVAQHIHPIESALIEMIQSMTPKCIREGILAKKDCGSEHEIIAGGGKHRTVTIPPGRWDPIVFIDLCSRREKLDRTTSHELNFLYENILKLVLRYELLRKIATNESCSLFSNQPK